MKLAVVLFNIGGPLATQDIAPYLFNFFMDRNIIRAPFFIRYPLAKWISWRRSRTAAGSAYAHLGGSSPLLTNTKEQATALEQELQKTHPSARVFVSMRYWHPFARDVVRTVADFKPDKVVLLPLYPQFSTTTAFSSLQDWHHACKMARVSFPSAEICCYADEPGFIEASAEHVAAALREAPKRVRVLFSAHGLPKNIVAGGDPYQHCCEKTARAIVGRLGIQGLDWQMCYQSRVGPLEWIGPSTEEALEKAAEDNIGIVVYPLAFVSEHVETLVEIDIEYRHRAKQLGIPYFAKAPTVGTHPRFIEGLRNIALAAAEGKFKPSVCPAQFSRCHCRTGGRT